MAKPSIRKVEMEILGRKCVLNVSLDAIRQLERHFGRSLRAVTANWRDDKIGDGLVNAPMDDVIVILSKISGVSEQKVAQHLDDLRTKEDSSWHFAILPVMDALLLAGVVTGNSFDMEVALKAKKDQDSQDEEGKEQAPEEPIPAQG